jgi:hypothetical protein
VTPYVLYASFQLKQLQLLSGALIAVVWRSEAASSPSARTARPKASSGTIIASICAISAMFAFRM